MRAENTFGKPRKKVCVVTGSRAEYGLLHSLLKEIRDDKIFDLQIVATGMHLSSEYGQTFKEIENDEFNITWKVESLVSSDTNVGLAKSVGLGIISFSECFSALKPDLVVVLGDRYEIFGAAQTAFFLKIPIAHICGGELTLGAIDDSIRHAITKISNYHFATCDEYRRRIIQLGEMPSNVFNIGSISADGIRNLKALNKAELETDLKIKIGDNILLVTYHPETLSEAMVRDELSQLFQALDAFPQASIIFTLPNSDPSGREIATHINNFCETRPNANVFVSLGRLRYLSLMKISSVVVGNSSSGLLEAPVFNKPSINIGARQEGRVRAETVFDVACDRTKIKSAISNALSLGSNNVFNANAHSQDKAYDGKSSQRIYQIMKNTILDIKGTKKMFNDLPASLDVK